MLRLLEGDCLDVMRSLPADSVDAVVTDPPYGLGFMGREWDKLPPGKEWAIEVFRVLKPGGYLVAFGGQRTIHRLTTAIEDGGFEVRDQIGWVYWNGFPKSLDVSKAIDAAAGAERAPATDAAIRWSGWGTALKPAIEPAILARKPFPTGSTVAANVLRYGTGALNIDACRYADGDRSWPGPTSGTWGGVQASALGYQGNTPNGYATTAHALGRWPANLYATPKASRRERELGCERLPVRSGADAVDRVEGSAGLSSPRAGSGRTADGVANFHPTVKPVTLMRWLARLVTRPGGVVLDPFMGSGTTGVACALEDFDFVGIERDPDYMPIARARIGGVLRGLWDKT